MTSQCSRHICRWAVFPKAELEIISHICAIRDNVARSGEYGRANIETSNRQGRHSKMTLDQPATHGSPPTSWPSKTKRHIADQPFLFEHNRSRFIGRERTLRSLLVPHQPSASFHCWSRKETYVKVIVKYLADTGRLAALPRTTSNAGCFMTAQVPASDGVENRVTNKKDRRSSRAAGS